MGCFTNVGSVKTFSKTVGNCGSTMGNLCQSSANKVTESNLPSIPSDNIFDDASIQFECQKTKELTHCLAAQRISQILITFSKFKQNPASCLFKSISEYINELSQSYNNKQLLNDYIHLINHHHTNQDFEDVYNFFISNMSDNKPCNVTSCNNVMRNIRDRSNDRDTNINMELYQSNESREINTQQILDKIHCYWLHTIDFGYRLNKRERDEAGIIDDDYDHDMDDGKEIEQYDPNSHKIIKDQPVYITESMDEDEEKLLKDCVDYELSRRQQIIRNKRQRLMQVNDYNANSPRPSDVDPGQRMLRRNKSIQRMLDCADNKFILNAQQGHFEMDKDKKLVYSFGYPYKYGKTWKDNDWYISQKYDSFKQEMIQKLNIQDWDSWLIKATEHHDTRHCQRIPEYLGDSISVDHILAVMLYCGVDVKYK